VVLGSHRIDVFSSVCFSLRASHNPLTNLSHACHLSRAGSSCFSVGQFGSPLFPLVVLLLLLLWLLLFRSVFPSVLHIIRHMLATYHKGGGLSTTPATGAFSLFFLVVYYPCYCYWIVSLLVPRRFLLPCCRSFVFSHFRWYIYIGGMLSASCRCAGSLPPSFSSMPCRLLSLFICLCAAKVGHA
jgi:hypothetical protein